MIKGKMAGIAFGGLAGYLLVSKVLNTVHSAVKNVCEASKWRSYYKYGKDNPDAVPPGYSKTTRYPDGREEEENDASALERNASHTARNGPVSEAVAKAIDDIFGRDKKQEEASEGQETASEEDNADDTDGDDILEESVKKAREAGVREEDILHNVSEIDQFHKKLRAV
jgi:hypothetical protein